MYKVITGNQCLSFLPKVFFWQVLWMVWIQDFGSCTNNDKRFFSLSCLNFAELKQKRNENWGSKECVPLLGWNHSSSGFQEKIVYFFKIFELKNWAGDSNGRGFGESTWIKLKYHRRVPTSKVVLLRLPYLVINSSPLKFWELWMTFREVDSESLVL